MIYTSLYSNAYSKILQGCEIVDENTIIYNGIKYHPKPQMGCENCCLRRTSMCLRVKCGSRARADNRNVIWVKNSADTTSYYEFKYYDN